MPPCREPLAAGLRVPKHGSCHRRHPLICGFRRAKPGSCHRYGVLCVTSSARCIRVVTGRGASQPPELPRNPGGCVGVYGPTVPVTTSPFCDNCRASAHYGGSVMRELYEIAKFIFQKVQSD